MDPSQLFAKKKELEEQIQKKQSQAQIPLSESVDELSLYDQHPADIASELSEREKDAGLLELLEFELEKVNDAISHYEEGKFGICEKCGQPIEEQRLQRLKNTTFCAHCAQLVQHDHPELKGGNLAASSMGDMGESFQVAGYEMYEE